MPKKYKILILFDTDLFCGSNGTNSDIYPQIIVTSMDVNLN